MMRTILGAMLLVLALAMAGPASAASFDCSKATTAFEKAICDNPKLSADDDTLAVAFATAIGGLSKPAVIAMRAEQRAWLDFAARSCTDHAEPLSDVDTYTDNQIECLGLAFSTRTGVLEQSRMLGGHRFAVSSSYSALPDPDAVDDPTSYWKVATHQLTYPALDGGKADAEGFDSFISDTVASVSGSITDEGGDAMSDAQSDTTVDITLSEVVGTRVTLKVMTNWFGHGAAHSNWGITYAHYLLGRQRAMEASDIFAGEGWEKTLTDIATAELKREHGDNLQLEGVENLGAIITDPSRWSFGSDYGLTIQFEPYEVAAYAYGAPTIVVPWESLGDIMSESSDSVRYGS
ncbi:MAG: hypothetical protein JWQ65_84 [Devosia sp.]|nr:hypothetical protein [Devosia sp.]